MQTRDIFPWQSGQGIKMAIFILQFPHQNTKMQAKLILSVDVDSSQH
jgi:hypothetical protein